ncbi:MAG: NAD(P)-binding domain-containing protein [Bryobacterales bacterium]|nr:NAD(P)-binding domain-containing protein [Bryobacterales bacterium]
MFKVWSEREILPDCVRLLNGVAEPIGPGSATPHDPLACFAAADCVLAGGLQYDGRTMDMAPNLVLISRMGIGFENVDLKAATERGIAVTYTPDGPTIATAEHAVSLMFAIAKDLKKASHGLLHDRRPDYYGRHSAVEIYGAQVGLVGLGRIGSRVAGLLAAAGAHVAAYDPYVDGRKTAELGVERVTSLPGLLGRSDIVSLHLPLNDSTRHLIGPATLAQMKTGAIVINVSRGGLVDEPALLAALDSGQVRGAGLDVTDPEPPAADNPLLHRPDVIVTPHVGSASHAGKRRILSHAIENLRLTLRQERPEHLLNPAVWECACERIAAAA